MASSRLLFTIASPRSRSDTGYQLQSASVSMAPTSICAGPTHPSEPTGLYSDGENDQNYTSSYGSLSSESAPTEFLRDHLSGRSVPSDVSQTEPGDVSFSLADHSTPVTNPKLRPLLISGASRRTPSLSSVSSAATYYTAPSPILESPQIHSEVDRLQRRNRELEDIAHRDAVEKECLKNKLNEMTAQRDALREKLNSRASRVYQNAITASTIGLPPSSAVYENEPEGSHEATDPFRTLARSSALDGCLKLPSGLRTQSASVVTRISGYGAPSDGDGTRSLAWRHALLARPSRTPPVTTMDLYLSSSLDAGSITSATPLPTTVAAPESASVRLARTIRTQKGLSRPTLDAVFWPL